MPAPTDAAPARRASGATIALARVVASLEPRTWRRLAVAVAVIQLVGVAVAAGDHLMLEGDGAFCVYAIAVGRPWLLKWADIAPRAAVYGLTAVPTAWIAQAAHLSPMAIADLNGLIFYAVPLAQFLVACALVWRRAPRLLAFPVATYACASAMQFGFPSEIALAPGFLWICLFLVDRGQAISLGALVGFVGLLFSHELAVPAAVIAAGFAAVRVRGGWRVVAVVVTALICLALDAALRLAGGTHGEMAPASAFPIATLLQSVQLWLGLGVAGLTLLAVRVRPKLFRQRLAWWATGALAAGLPLALALSPSIDFEQGLYPTGRTVIALAMASLAGLFVAARLDGDLAPDPMPPLASRAAAPVVFAALACMVGCAAAFLTEFNLEQDGLRRLVAATPGRGPPLLSVDDAAALVVPAEAAVLRHRQFAWTLPYRSAVLADGAVPAHLIYDRFNASAFRDYCTRAGAIDPARSAIPPVALAEVKAYACAQ